MRTHRIIRFFLILTFFVFQLKPTQASLTTDTEIEALFATIESNYAPLQYKEQRFSMEWHQLKETYRNRLLQAQSTQELYRTFSELLGEFRDAHVSIQLPSDYAKTLPMQFSYIDGKTVATFIDQKIFDQQNCNVNVGDLLVSIDGQSPEALREQLLPTQSTGNRKTDLSYLTRSLTSWKEQRGMEIPFGKESKFFFSSRLTGQNYSCDLKWDTTGFPIINKDAPLDRTPPNVGEDPAEYTPPPSLGFMEGHLANQIVNQESVSDRIQAVLQLQSQLINLSLTEKSLPQSSILDLLSPNSKNRGVLITLGAPQPIFKLPKGFKEIKAPSLAKALTASTGLYAGKFKHGDQKIGFLRIPSYVPPNLVLSYFGLRYLIGKLEKETDLLIIDQTHNPGGYVAFSDWIVSSLTGTFDVEKHMSFSVKPTQSFLRMYASLYAALENELEKARENVTSEKDDEKRAYLSEKVEFLVNRLQLVYEQLQTIKNGYDRNQRLSQPVSMALVSYIVEDLVNLSINELIKENDTLYKVIRKASKALLKVDMTQKQVYTKPIFMMINELDFSGGDATPAVLKDYGRVTLVGSTTAGAGGSVSGFSNDILNPFQFRLTQSLMLRPGGVLVENNGVKPDIIFEPKLEDYQDSFRTYFSRVLNSIL